MSFDPDQLKRDGKIGRATNVELRNRNRATKRQNVMRDRMEIKVGEEIDGVDPSQILGKFCRYMRSAEVPLTDEKILERVIRALNAELEKKEPQLAVIRDGVDGMINVTFSTPADIIMGMGVVEVLTIVLQRYTVHVAIFQPAMKSLVNLCLDSPMTRNFIYETLYEKHHVDLLDFLLYHIATPERVKGLAPEILDNIVWGLAGVCDSQNIPCKYSLHMLGRVRDPLILLLDLLSKTMQDREQVITYIGSVLKSLAIDCDTAIGIIVRYSGTLVQHTATMMKLRLEKACVPYLGLLSQIAQYDSTTLIENGIGDLIALPTDWMRRYGFTEWLWLVVGLAKTHAKNFSVEMIAGIMDVAKTGFPEHQHAAINILFLLWKHDPSKGTCVELENVTAEYIHKAAAFPGDYVLAIDLLDTCVAPGKIRDSTRSALNKCLSVPLGTPVLLKVHELLGDDEFFTDIEDLPQ